MSYKGSLFYNYKVMEDTLIIVIDNKAFPNVIKKSNDVVGLYKDNSLIGVNIFNSNSLLKLRLNGLVHNPNEPLINLVHTIISSELDEDVVLIPSEVVVGKIISIKDDSYVVSLGNDEFKKAGILIKEDLNENQYVLLSKRGNRLDNGDMSDDYLLQDEEYLIIGSEVDLVDDDSLLGKGTYSIEED